LKLLASVVIFGRVCLQWAQELQLQVEQVTQQDANAAWDALTHAKSSALQVCCYGFGNLPQVASGLGHWKEHKPLCKALAAAAAAKAAGAAAGAAASETAAEVAG
jgi:hypothetical protein